MKNNSIFSQNDKQNSKFKNLFVYTDLNTGQVRRTVPLWVIILFVLSVVVFYFSAFQQEFIVNLFGVTLNYFLPIFYIFLIMSYFIIILSNQI